MDRINGANTEDIGGGRRGFRDRNLLAGVSGTQVTAAFLTGVQEEVIGVIEAAGLTPSPANNGQLLAAIQALLATGVSTAQLLAASGYKALSGGLILQWGSATVPAAPSATASSVAVAFPLAFPTACFAAVASTTSIAHSIGWYPVAAVTAIGPTGFTLAADILGGGGTLHFDLAVGARWFAVGH